MRRKTSNDSGSIFSDILTGQLINNMPDDVWLNFAWMLCVDSQTYNETRVTQIAQGIMVVQCNSVYAANQLESPSPILDRWRKLNLTRALPPVNQIAVTLGQLSGRPAQPPSTASTNLPSNQEIEKYTAAVNDQTLGKMLARIAAKHNFQL